MEVSLLQGPGSPSSAGMLASVISSGILFLLIMVTYNGGNWARIILVVFSILGFLFSLIQIPNLLQEQELPSLALHSGTQATAQLLLIIFLLRPASGRWIRNENQKEESGHANS
tara:strand:- start:64 stop:405 length:342 start_codon:yes stop_codon:yes gene_type:complete